MLKYNGTLSEFIEQTIGSRLIDRCYLNKYAVDTLSLILNTRIAASDSVLIDTFYIDPGKHFDITEQLFTTVIPAKRNHAIIQAAVHLKAQYSLIESITKRQSKKYFRLVDAEAFLAQKGYTCVIVHSARLQSTIVITNGSAPNTYILPLLPKLLPEIFFEKPITTSEVALLHGLYSGSKGDINDFDNVLAESGIKAEYYEFILNKAFSNQRSTMIADLTNKLSLVQRELRSLTSNLNRQLSERSKLECILHSLENSNTHNSNASDVINYFDNNGALRLLSVSGKNIEYAVETTLDYFEDELYKRYRQTPSSSLNQYLKRCAGLPELMDAIILDKTIKIATYSVFRIGVDYTFEIETNPEYQFPDLCPNPHIMRYSCLGGNSVHIYSSLHDGDYILAIEQSVAATKNINIADTTVFSYFTSYLASTRDAKFYRLPDNSYVNFNQALKWVKTHKTGE